MLKNKVLRRFSYLVATSLPVSALAHPGHSHDSHLHLMHYAAMALVPLAIIGSLYLLLIVIGKSKIKEGKTQ